MHLFADYIQPLTDWLQANPRWSLFITFIIALSESLAIVGSIIPGSVTMTAIGILAGSGIMRIDLTLIAAILGAFFGDSLSYAIGYLYRDKISFIWPFSKYPHWLHYGKDFFASHGGKSVLIGRFIGPLRSIIPLIAGIMHMKQWRFLLANFLSAIGWSILYIMPGVLIGAAGHELSAESATRLFIIILVLLVIIWLLGRVFKWFYAKLSTYLKANLHRFWAFALKIKGISTLLSFFTPEEEVHHYQTARLFFLMLLSITLLCFSLFIMNYTYWFNYINYPLHYFSLSFHNEVIQMFLIIFSQSTSSITLISLYIVSLLLCIIYKDKRSIIYITSTVFSSLLFAFILSKLTRIPYPQGLMEIKSGSSLPDINLLIGTSFYGFLVLTTYAYNNLITGFFKIFIVIVLLFNGFSALLLSDYWFSDIIFSYLIGITLCIFHFLLYNKIKTTHILKKHTSMSTSILLCVLVCSSSISVVVHFKTIQENHKLYHERHSLFKAVWWHQKKPILPVYRLNRLGTRISMLNIQYAGDLFDLQKKLESRGWELHNESFFTKLIMMLTQKPNNIRLPLLDQLFDNRRPELIMSYRDKSSNKILELYIWESNYFLLDYGAPLWIGTIHQNLHTKKRSSSDLFNPINYLVEDLKEYHTKKIKIPNTMLHDSTYYTAPYILLIEK